MKKHVLIIVLMLVSFYSQAQTLGFSLSADTVFVNNAVTATNTSAGFPSGTLFIWNFGDSCVNLPSSNPAEVIPAGGTVCNDTIAGLGNVVYAYRGAGAYTVTLICYDTLNNCNNSYTQSIIVRNRPYNP